MADTTFKDEQEPRIEAAWLNDINDLFYTTFGGSQPAATDGNFLVGDGSNYVAESGSTARTSLGAGGLADNNTWTGTQAWQGNVSFEDVTYTINNTDAGASAGPVVTLYRNSASPVSTDDIGQIDFDGEDDGGNQTTYARLKATIQGATDTSEDGILQAYSMVNGTIKRQLWMYTGLAVGENNSAGGTGQLNVESDLTVSGNSSLAGTVSGAAVATQANQEAETSGKIVTSSAQHHHPTAAKVWVGFQADGTIDASYGVSSIDDDATGNFGVNFSTNFSLIDGFVPFGSTLESSGPDTFITFDARAAGSVDFQVIDDAGSTVDANRMFVCAFGDQ